MGRGPGNTKTEELINFFNKGEKSTNQTIKELVSLFSNLKRKYKWGTNRYYQLSGNIKFIQRIFKICYLTRGIKKMTTLKQ